MINILRYHRSHLKGKHSAFPIGRTGISHPERTEWESRINLLCKKDNMKTKNEMKFFTAIVDKDFDFLITEELKDHFKKGSTIRFHIIIKEERIIMMSSKNIIINRNVHEIMDNKYIVPIMDNSRKHLLFNKNLSMMTETLYYQIIRGKNEKEKEKKTNKRGIK